MKVMRDLFPSRFVSECMRMLRNLLVALVSVALTTPAGHSVSPHYNRPIRKLPCTIAFIGDSATSSVYSPPGFPALVGRDLGVAIHNLAIVSPTRDRASYTVQEASIEEVPRVPTGTTDAVVFLGTDDLGPLATGQEALLPIEHSLSVIIGNLKARKIRIYLITVGNYSLDPKFPNPPKENVPAWQANMGRATDAFDNFELTQGLPTLDIRGYPDLMSFGSYQDAVHFNAAGIRLMAGYVERWFRGCYSNPRLRAK